MNRCVCPKCNRRCQVFAWDKYGQLLGCEFCVDSDEVDVEEWEDAAGTNTLPGGKRGK